MSNIPPRIPITLPDLPKRPSYAVRKRDEALRRMARKIRRLAPTLDDAKFSPVLRSFCMTTLLAERLYGRIRQMSDAELVRPDGSAAPAVDSLRNLARSQASIARELGLVPSVANLLKQQTPDLAALFATQPDEDTVAETLPDED